jgi:hypothetical protein
METGGTLPIPSRAPEAQQKGLVREKINFYLKFKFSLQETAEDSA